MRFLIFLLCFSTAYAGECTKDKAKLHFLETCVGYLEGAALRNGAVPTDKIKEECRCAALNFPVENLVRPDCEYDYDDIYMMMKLDSTRLRCQ